MDDQEKPRRVLVADDVKMLALKISGALKAQDYETAVAADGEQYLEMVESFQPNLLILDIMMPKVHGIEVLQRLQSKDVGVIVCTAKDFETDRSKFQELGAWAVIVKPFAQDQVVAKVDQYFSLPDDLDATWTAPLPRAKAAAFQHERRTGAGSCRLWGTRGSIPVSEPQFLRHGGNTSCMSIDHGEDCIIFDAGSRIRRLEMALMSEGPRQIHLFVTHTHWDHIQGFPFFAPAWTPGFDITVYGAEGFGKDLKSVFQGQLDRDYFPVQMEGMPAHLEFKQLSGDSVRIGDAVVTWEFAQHPGATLG